MAQADCGGEDSVFLPYDGPDSTLSYPLDVLYIDDCDGWPLEYCEYHPNYQKAKEWMENHLTDDMKQLYLGGHTSKSGKEEAGEGDSKELVSEEKKRQKRGGKGQIKTKKKVDKVQKVAVFRASRGKKKYTTVVTGLATYDIDLRKASKMFGSFFACGSSVTGEDEIVIQGDVKYEMFEFIPKKWPEIDEDTIADLGDQKRQ